MMEMNEVFAATGIYEKINFQGKLVNSDGTNVTDGNYSIVFTLYDASSAGTNLWDETQTVTVTDGVFQVELGAVDTTIASVDFNSDTLYLGVKVGADSEMTPRIRFTAVPYAFNAEKVNGLTVTNTTGTFTLTSGKTLSVSNSLTFAGTDGTTFTFPNATGTVVTQDSSDTLTNKTLTAPRFADLGFLADSSGNELLIFDSNASAVNELTISNGATGVGPTIIASGETNVSLTINSKAAGAITLDSGTTGIVNVGTGNNAKTLNLGTGTAGNTINIGTNNTTLDTINIGSVLDDVAITGDQWSITNAGALTVQSCSGCGGGGSTLQQAYDTGNTITTDATGDITFTLAELTTPTTFEIFNNDTAGIAGVEIDNTIASGTLTNGLFIEQSGAGTMTNAINILETAGTITDGILITGILGNILNSGSIDITGAGAITGATGLTLSSGSITYSSTGNLTLAGGAITDSVGSVILNDALDISGIITSTNATTGIILGATTDITTGTNENLTISPNGTGDIVISGDADTNLQVTFGAAPAVDMAVISNSGQGTTTTGVDGLSIDFTQGDDADGGETNAGLSINVTSSSGDADTVYGINIANITGGSANEYALRVGIGWDQGLIIESGGSTNSGLVYSGDGRPTKTITISPEYAGGVLTAYYGAGTDTNITGSMTSDTDTTQGTSIRNYYQWERTTDATQHFYTVAVRVTLPADFDAWATSNALTVSYRTESATNTVSDLDVRVYNENSATEITGGSNLDNASTSWTTEVIDDSVLDDGVSSEWDAAGETSVIYLRMGSASSNYVQIGDIQLNYLAKF